MLPDVHLFYSSPPPSLPLSLCLSLSLYSFLCPSCVRILMAQGLARADAAVVAGAGAQEDSDAALARRLAQELNMDDGHAAAAANLPPIPYGPGATSSYGSVPPPYGHPVAATQPHYGAPEAPVVATPLKADPALAPPPFPAFVVPDAPPAYAAVGTPASVPSSAALENLVSMGFGRDAAAAALASNNNDQELALNLLLGAP